jgi:hypothetical protein
MAHALPLLADVLAFLALEIGEEIPEFAPVAGIAPMELHVAAHQPRRIERVELGFGQEIDMHRRDVECWRDVAYRVRQSLPMASVFREQARAGYRRVGHGNQPFRVVGLAHAFVGMRPGMVEHEFAVGIGFQVRRCRRHEYFALEQGGMAGCPTPVRAQAAVALESREERV